MGDPISLTNKKKCVEFILSWEDLPHDAAPVYYNTE